MKRFLAMPDWRRKEDYDYTSKLTLEQWAWEFLRRNPLYREAYSEFIIEIQDIESIHGDLSAYSQEELYEIEGVFIFTPERLSNEGFFEWYSRCMRENLQHEWVPLSKWRAREWGINGFMVDPYKNDVKSPEFSATPKYPKLVGSEECSDFFTEDGFEQKAPYVLVAINLCHSLNDQMIILNKILSEKKEMLRSEETIQTPRNKGRMTIWPEHLRLIDGLDDGASYKEIGNALFPSIKMKKDLADKVSDRKKIAFEYRDIRYRYLSERIISPDK